MPDKLVAHTKWELMRLKAIDWFMRGYSKEDALLKAGYSEVVAKSDAGSVFNRPEVKAEIERRQQRAMEKSQVDANWIIARLKEIAEANLGDLLVIEDDGSARFDMNKMTPSLRAALGEFTVDSYNEGRGENKKVVKKMRVKLADKLRALEMLGKHLGLFADRIKLEGDADLIERLYAGRKRVGAPQEEEENDNS